MERIVRPAAGLTALYYLRDFLIRGKSRRWWVRPSNQYRSTEGYFETDYDRMRQRDPDYFQESIRMSPSTFDLLLRKVRSRLEKFSFRRPISPACRLFLTLMYLAHGTPVAIMARMFKMGESTIRNITMEVSDVLWEVLVRDYLPVPLEEDFRRYAEEFKEKWKFPNCCGAIDGKHVAIQCPPNAGSTFYNYKGYHSIVLMGLCNANYEFLMVDIGAFGGNSDGGIFSNCIFGQLLLQNQVGLPEPCALPNTEVMFPHFIVGDSAFPLKNNLMRPYPGTNLPPRKENFNTRLSIARRTIENTFGILVSRWRSVDLQPENAMKVVKASIILHNFLKKLNSEVYCPERYVDQVDGSGNIIIEGEWRANIEPLLSVSAGEVQRGNNASRNAMQLRDKLADYLILN